MNRVVPLFLLVGLVFGCSTTRDYTPEFRPSGRHGLDLVRPVNLAFFDARSDKKDDLAMVMQAGVQQAYGKNARITPYFSPPASAEVTVKVRILRLQSDFGSRVVSVPVLLNSQSAAAAAATNGWNTVVAAASASSQTLGTGIVAEGWWIGTSEIEVEVIDFSRGRNVKFTVPLVTETRESNMWGYASASAAAKRAWKSTEAQFMRILDDVFLKVSEADPMGSGR